MITLYEPLGLDEGHTLLEIGVGSGYTIVIAREIVGPQGRVVCVEIDPETFENAKTFIENTGYTDIVLVLGDGYFGYPELSPYDRICITAACEEIPPPLIEQLRERWKTHCTGDKGRGSANCAHGKKRGGHYAKGYPRSRIRCTLCPHDRTA